MAAASHSRYSAIDGMVRSTNVTHEAMLRREAVEYLHGIHRAQCVLGATPLIFVMWECTGLGGDLTSLARALVIAASQRRQVIVLPPNRAARAVCRLPPNISTSMRQPWHWLSGDGGSVDELPLDSVYVKSACQLHIEGRADLLRELESVWLRGPEGAASRSGEGGNLSAVARNLTAVSRWYGRGNTWRIGLTPNKFMPARYRAQGLLWWFQVATTYAIRVRGPLAKLVRAHPAMRPFVAPRGYAEGALADGGEGAPDAVEPGGARAQGRLPHSGEGGPHFGWRPAARFDLGLHIRVGDACQGQSSTRYYALRKCQVTASLNASLAVLRRAGFTNGSLFIATNSRRIIREVQEGAARPFAVSYARLDRGEHLNAATQLLSGVELRRRVLVESLLDLLLLSRADVIAGPMMSSFPRLAMQLRVQPPLLEPGTRYVSLDGYPWCTRSSCRMDYMARFGTA